MYTLSKPLNVTIINYFDYNLIIVMPNSLVDGHHIPEVHNLIVTYQNTYTPHPRKLYLCTTVHAVTS
jgi:hypothetical protein